MTRTGNEENPDDVMVGEPRARPAQPTPETPDPDKVRLAIAHPHIADEQQPDYLEYGRRVAEAVKLACVIAGTRNGQDSDFVRSRMSTVDLGAILASVKPPVKQEVNCTCPSSAVHCRRHGESRAFMWRDHADAAKAAAYIKGLERALVLAETTTAASPFQAQICMAINAEIKRASP